MFISPIDLSLLLNKMISVFAALRKILLALSHVLKKRVQKSLSSYGTLNICRFELIELSWYWYHRQNGWLQRISDINEGHLCKVGIVEVPKLNLEEHRDE